MALRLTDAPAAGIKPNAAPSSAPSTPAIPLAALLLARAESVLAVGDVAAYRAIFAEAARIEDPSRRYQARRRLLEAGLGISTANFARVAPIFAAVALEAVTVLEENPREPILLNYAGIALYELVELGAAEKLFQAAHRLDPNLEHLAMNLEELRRRKKGGAPKPQLPGPVTAALRSLAPRAKRVAAQAQPVEGMTMSLCMIVKDEEAMLGRCLASVAGHVDEIIVVDTGSTDRTVEIAESFGARVLHHEWTGDFSEARNLSFDAATSDWMFYLDADEVLVDGEGPRLRALAGHTWREGMWFVETNHTGAIEDATAVTHNALRLFRNRPEHRFEGRIHEQIAHRLPSYLPERLEVTDVRIEHFGYLGVVRDEKDKSRRNIELLERQVAEGDDSPFLHYNLGSEYAAMRENDTAVGHFRTAWEKLGAGDSHTKYPFVPSLAGRYVKALRIVGRYDEATTVGDQVLQIFPGYTDVVLEQAIVAEEQDNLPRAIELLEQCVELGEAPSHYSPTVGCGTYLPLLGLADLHLREGRVEQADAFARRCLAEYPDYPGLAEPYAKIRLKAGAAPAEVVAELRDGAGELVPGARFLLAAVLQEAGAPVEAEAELRAVVSAQPSSAPVRLALSETLLAQGRLPESIEVVEAIEEDSPWAPQAQRTIAFASLAQGDAPRARGALQGNAAALLPDGERQALDAWAAAVAGDEPPATLPADAAPVVLRMLEALTRIEEFDAFEVLAGRYETIAMEWRERREQLAALYLRRGFLASAGDEWIQVCQTAGPDARALVGLAQVAFLRDMTEDARLFAEEARQLDPTNATAVAVLQHVGAAA
jgi:glycosyltransferase involved in cell wall biosynthesis